MSRVLLATTLAAAGASGFLTSSCPAIEVDITCQQANDCGSAVVLVHGPEGKFYDPLEYVYTAGAAFNEIEDIITEDGTTPIATVANVLALTDVDGDKLCGDTAGTGVETLAGPVVAGASFTTIDMAPENNGSGCKCSDMYFTIIVQTDAGPGNSVGILYNHKLESTSEASVAYGTTLAQGTGNEILDAGVRSFTVKFTPDGSSTSSWLNWWIFSHWF